MKKLPDLLLGGRMIVKILESKEEKHNGIIIPKTANAELVEGLVVKVDPETEKVVKIGDIVVFPEGAGVGQLIDGQTHLWLEAMHVWGCFSMDQE